MNRSMAAASAGTSRGGKSRPVSPSITSSGLPSTAVATTGVATARLSRSVPVSPSPRYDASTEQSLPARISATSSR